MKNASMAAMKPILALFSLFFLLLLSAQAPAQSATEARLRIGLNDGFTRLVVEFPSPPSFTVGRENGAVTLNFTQSANINSTSLRPKGNITAVSATATAPLRILVRTRPENARIRHFTLGTRAVLDVYPDSDPKAASEPAKTPAISPAPKAEIAAAPKAEKPAAPKSQPAHATALPPARILLQPPSPAGLIAFQRGAFLWLGVDQRLSGLPPTLTGARARELGAPFRLDPDGATLFRYRLPAGLTPIISQQKATWQIDLIAADTTTPPALQAPQMGRGPDKNSSDKNSSQILLRARDVGTAFTMTDPLLGDRLVLIPLRSSGQGLASMRRFVDFDLLASLQGIALRARADGLTVLTGKDTITITGKEPLNLSKIVQNTIAAAPESAPDPTLPRLYDFQSWARGDANALRTARKGLETLANRQEEAARPPVWIDLARLELAHGRGAEAQGWLDLVRQANPDSTTSPEYRSLRGVSRLLNGDTEGASEDFAAPELASQPEIALWQALTLARQDKWPDAAKKIGTAWRYMLTYPKALQDRFAPLLADILIRDNQLETAKPVLNLLQPAEGQTASPAFAVLDGMVKYRQKDPANALAEWRPITRHRDQYWRVRAQLETIRATRVDKSLTEKEAIAGLEQMRAAWRGDQLEIEILLELADAYFKDSQWREGMRTLALAKEVKPGNALAETAAATLKHNFNAIFIEKNGTDKVAPLDALSLYQEFSYLAPKGAASVTARQTLADRLISIDLLDKATDLLQNLVDTELQGTAKAATGTRIAGLHLLDGKPREALTALDKSNVAEISPELAEERTVLRARALFLNGKHTEALALLADRNSSPALMLRADIAGKNAAWGEATTALSAIASRDIPAGDASLAPAQSALILRLTVAAILAGDSATIAEIRQNYSTRMAKTPQASAFAALTAADAPADSAAAFTQSTDTDLFRNFLQKYTTDTKAGDTKSTP